MSTTSLSAFEKCQQESIDFLASHFHAGCGDVRGAGKTKTALKAAVAVGAETLLVVCPASVRTNWEAELFELPVRGIWSRVVSYNMALDAPRDTLSDKYDVCIVDEEHFCKEPDSQRANAVFGPRGLASKAKYKWCLSGTFAPNGRPVEYFPMLKALHPHFAKMSFAAYAQRYCGAFYDGRAMNNKGASNIEEFKGLLDEFIITHSYAQVFPGRTEPVLIHVPVDLAASEMLEVNAAERAMISRPAMASPTRENFSQLGDSATLRRLLGEAIIPHAANFVHDKLEGVRKVVVFYQHTDVGVGLALRLNQFNPVVYRGGMSDTKKEEIKRTFREDAKCRVAVIQQQAGGTGMNGLQQVSSTCVFAEPDWTPGETEQRVGRLDRMGAEGDVVTAYVLYARGTMQAAVLGVHDRKDKIREKLQ